ncbi:MAG TPA: hypothetical protein VG435_09780 [Acidimicrobiales bacterium]|jgi:hypothetical protein|nr:hypothetical protein [Acidimicrobiales bacterium]
MIEELQRLRSSKVITYFLAEGAAIGEDVVPWLYKHLLQIGHQDQIDLFLVSRGGATDVPWRIVTLIREFADRFCVLVPYHAASAATHICLGADEVVMTEVAQLGPVDPSRMHPLLPNDPFIPAGQDPKPLSISVQDLRQFIQFVARTDNAENMQVSDPTAIYTELMRHVHPLVIGAMEQTYTLAKQLTKSMLALHMDPVAEADKIEQLADRFADYYQSHSYPISRRELKDLGLNVLFAPDDLRDAMWGLYEHYTQRRMHIDAQAMSLGASGTTQTISADAASYVDSEVASAVGFRSTDKNGKVIGGMWIGWYP